MKSKLLFLALLFSIIAEAQITKSEAFLTGTKLAFYPNQCGNTIPEAANKLTFCDGIDNLGVVERSYGLNDRRVESMLPNYFNADEYYVTGKGLSIRNTDGTWENIPNIAIPTFNTQGDWTNAGDIRNGVVLPNGNVIIHASNANYGLNLYDRTLKTFTPINFPNNRFPYVFAYDADRAITWIVASGGGASGRYLFTYDGTNLDFIQELVEAGNVSATASSTTLIYNNDHLYLGSINGLFKINITDYTIPNIITTEYSSSTVPALPFDRVNDLQFDTNGDLWLAQSASSSDGGIVKFNITNETYDLYQLVTTNNASVNYAFDAIALDETGLIWASASNYSGIMELTFPGNVATWNLLSSTDLDNLNVPITFRPDNIYYRNNQFYFTTVDFSSGSNSNFEVVINNNNIWSGRNDDEAGNLSSRMSRRFTNVLPDENGGVWWFNAFDDIVVYRDSNDNHQSIDIDNMTSSAVIDDDNNAIVRGGSPNELRKIDFPNANSIQDGTHQVDDMKRVADQVWIFDRNNKNIYAYKDDVLINTYNLDEDWYENVFDFAVDDDGNAWFMRNNTGSLIIKKFDIGTLTTTTYDTEVPDVNLSTLRKVVTAPNGGVWFIGTLGAVYQENEMFYDFIAADYNEIYNLRDIVVDINGKAYLLNNDNASITTIENPTNASPTLTNISLEHANSVMPSLDHFRPDALTIDSEGSIWTHASENVFKLIDLDMAMEYIPNPQSLSVSENQLDSNFRIYPNPTRDKVNVQSQSEIKAVEMYSILGQKVLEATHAEIDISHLEKGTYIVRIITYDSIFNKKLIIN